MAVYRGEAARKPAPIHYQPSTLRPGLACDELLADLPAEDTATFRLGDVTCESCLDAVASPVLRTSSPQLRTGFALTQEHR